MFKAKQRFTSFIVAFVMMIAAMFTMFSALAITPKMANAADGTWTLVTDASTLKTDDQIIITAKDKAVALSTTQNGNNRGQTAITKNTADNTLAAPSSSVQILTLKVGKTSGTWAFYTGSNYLRTETSLSANSSWNITITSAGVATVKATGSNTRNWLRHNSGNSIFSCYGSGQNDICLYKFIVNENPPSISIDNDIPAMQVGGTFALTATTENLTEDLTWTSSNTNVATVDNGTVTAVTMGKATITASANDVKATKTVTVYPTEDSELSIADAITVSELTGANQSPFSYSATGLVESIDTAYDADNNNITVTITDGTDSIQANLEGGSDLEENTSVTVTGYLQTNGGVPQFVGAYTINESENADAILAELNSIDAYMSLSFKYTQTTVPSTNTEVLTREETGITKNNSTYGSWTYTAPTGTTYAGNSAGGNDSIQMRSDKSTSGIVTTASKGKATKITVVWQSNTSSGRTLNVYGKNTVYSAATDLYNNSTQGTLLGTIVYGKSVELTITGDYEYIGLRSNSGAMYLTSVSIDWTTDKTEKALSDSDFRIRCGVDASLAEIEGVEEYGIRVSAANGNTKLYTSDDAKSWSKDEENGKYYVVISLGDIINNDERLETEFTVEAYVKVNGLVYTSELNKTYSVVSLIEEYYNKFGEQEEYKAVAYLYNYFVEKGLI